MEIHHPLQFLDLEKIRLIHSPSPYTEQPPLSENSSDFSADIKSEIETEIETDTNKLGKRSHLVLQAKIMEKYGIDYQNSK